MIYSYLKKRLGDEKEKRGTVGGIKWKGRRPTAFPSSEEKKGRERLHQREGSCAQA